jgi:hypothetical protein
MTNSRDSELAAKITVAVKAADAAIAMQEKAMAVTVGASRAVGLLLLEAKKLHPAVKDFEAFLKRVDGLKLSRAYDLLRLAGGRTTDEELKKDARERQQKARDKKKLPEPEAKKPEPKSEPKPVSVTSRKDGAVGNDTESADASSERRRAEYATPEEKEAAWSAANLREFECACRTYLPRIRIEADRQKAFRLVAEMTDGKPKAEAA